MKAASATATQLQTAVLARTTLGSLLDECLVLERQLQTYQAVLAKAGIATASTLAAQPAAPAADDSAPSAATSDAAAPVTPARDEPNEYAPGGPPPALR